MTEGVLRGIALHGRLLVSHAILTMTVAYPPISPHPFENHLTIQNQIMLTLATLVMAPTQLAQQYNCMLICCHSHINPLHQAPRA